MTFIDELNLFSKEFLELDDNAIKMPGNAFFVNNGDILSIPDDEVDCRYPYGANGLNFWAYSSGYMHCNKGLFSPILRTGEGKEPNIAFFAGFPDGTANTTYTPLLSVPKCGNIAEETEVERYSIFTSSAVYYMTKLQGLSFGIRIFASDTDEIFFSVHVVNNTTETKKLFLSSYMNLFLCNQIFENSENRWFREVKVVKNGTDNLPAFVIKTNEDISRTQTVSHYGVIRRNIELTGNSKLIKHEETASRNQYVGGIRSSLHSAASLKAGTFGNPQHICTFTETGIAGDMLHIELPPNESARIDMCLSFQTAIAKPEDFSLPTIQISGKRCDELLEVLKRNESEKNGKFKASFAESSNSKLNPEVMSYFFKHLQKQVEFCSLIKGFVQLSEFSLIGIRDVFQAIEAFLVWQPEAAREKILEALGFISPEGRAPRQYSLPTSTGVVKMDLRPFIDQGVWVISTLMTYLRTTDDFSILEESCGYYEIIDEKKNRAVKSTLCDSVLNHMFRIMEYLIEKRDPLTKCSLALYGDWNDALDGLGVSRKEGQSYGTGVSVMASLQLYQNLQEMIELLEARFQDRYSDKLEHFRAVMLELEEGLKRYAVVENDEGMKRLLHGWGDARSYLVGGFSDPDGQPRDGLTSNAFWVLSNLFESTPSLRSSIISAFKRLDSKYGLKTFAPAFPENTPGVGRIPKLPPGTAENGASYIHATAFGIMALFKMGEPEMAWEQLIKILPFTHDKIFCSPYTMPNSYGYNKEKMIDGESMQDWQTGSSNVVMKTLIWYVFGIKPCLNGIWIQPAVASPFASFEFALPVKSSYINLRYQNKNSTSRTFTINGERLKGEFDTHMKIEKLWIPADKLQNNSLEITVQD